MSVRTSSLVVAVLLSTVGGAAALTGATVLALTGTDSALSSRAVSLASPGSAVVTADGDLDPRGTDGLGVRLRLTVHADEPVFIGVGRAADVDRYLAGAATDVVEDVEVRPLRVVTEHREGSERPAPPGRQPFWLTQSGGGTQATVTWPVSDGLDRVVVMNADGSAGVHARVTTTVHVRHLAGAGVGLLAGGLAGVLAGAGVLLRGRRRPPRAPAQQAGPSTDGGPGSVPVDSDHRHDQPAPTP